jgi:integrase
LIPESATEPHQTVASTREEVKAILAHLATEGLTLQRAAVALIAYTGVRPGEARGLRWEEWNRTACQIKVARSVWHTVEGTTKTTQSNRFVTVTDELREILLDLWKSQGSPLGGYILAQTTRKSYKTSHVVGWVVGWKEFTEAGTAPPWFPRTPSERSRWRDGRFACYAPHVMPQGRAFNCDFRFSLIFLSQAKSISCKRKKIQFP